MALACHEAELGIVEETDLPTNDKHTTNARVVFWDGKNRQLLLKESLELSKNDGKVKNPSSKRSS